MELRAGEWSDSDSNSTATVISYPPVAAALAGVFAIVFIIVGVIGNVVTILALTKNRKLRPLPTTWFVLNLCASDLLFCTVNLPFLASRYLNNDWVHGKGAICRALPFLLYSNVPTSILSLVAITINRYVLIVHMQWYSWIYSRRNTIIFLCFIWIFTFGFMMLPLFGLWGEFGWDPATGWCTLLRKNGESPRSFLFIFFFLVPCVAIIFCYSLIYRRVRQSRRNLTSVGNNRMGVTDVAGAPCSNIAREELQLTKMMLLIFVTFVVSNVPIMIVNVMDYETEYPMSLIVASILLWSTSGSDLIIYVLCNRQYRRAYEELLLCRSKRMSQQDITSVLPPSGYQTTVVGFRTHLTSVS